MTRTTTKMIAKLLDRALPGVEEVVDGLIELRLRLDEQGSELQGRDKVLDALIIDLEAFV